MTPTPDSSAPHIFLSCGEASGERYGVALVRALRERCPDVILSGLGGEALAEAGVTLVARADELAVMGFTDVAAALPSLLKARNLVRRCAVADDIDLVIPVDFPGFNLDLATHVKAQGKAVYFLVAPQLWAWGGWRIGKLRRAVDRLGTLLPFERAFFETRGVSCDALGHPLMDDYLDRDVQPTMALREARLRDTATPLTLGLLPGSRRQEIANLVPLLAAVITELKLRRPDRSFQGVVSVAPGAEDAWFEPLPALGCTLTHRPLPDLLPDLDMAVVCSGTASLEASLAGVPHALVYRTSPLNYVLARLLVNVESIGLANLISDLAMVREHVQGAALPRPVVDDLEGWLDGTSRRRRFTEHVATLRHRLGPPGFWARTADSILGLVTEHIADA